MKTRTATTLNPSPNEFLSEGIYKTEGEQIQSV